MEPLATVNPSVVSCSRLKKWPKSRSISLKSKNVKFMLFIDRAIFLLHVCLNVYTKPKEKVGQWTLLQAVHYARGNESNKVIIKKLKLT